MAVASSFYVIVRGEELWGTTAKFVQWCPVALAAFAAVGSVVQLWRFWRRATEDGEPATERRVPPSM